MAAYFPVQPQRPPKLRPGYLVPPPPGLEPLPAPPADPICVHCGNASSQRDRRGCCIGCGGPR